MAILSKTGKREVLDNGVGYVMQHKGDQLIWVQEIILSSNGLLKPVKKYLEDTCDYVALYSNERKQFIETYQAGKQLIDMVISRSKFVGSRINIKRNRE